MVSNILWRPHAPIHIELSITKKRILELGHNLFSSLAYQYFEFWPAFLIVTLTFLIGLSDNALPVLSFGIF